MAILFYKSYTEFYSSVRKVSRTDSECNMDGILLGRCSLQNKVDDCMCLPGVICG